MKILDKRFYCAILLADQVVGLTVNVAVVVVAPLCVTYILHAAPDDVVVAPSLPLRYTYPVLAVVDVFALFGVIYNLLPLILVVNHEGLVCEPSKLNERPVCVTVNVCCE